MELLVRVISVKGRALQWINFLSLIQCFTPTNVPLSQMINASVVDLIEEGARSDLGSALRVGLLGSKHRGPPLDISGAL